MSQQDAYSRLVVVLMVYCVAAAGYTATHALYLLPRERRKPFFRWFAQTLMKDGKHEREPHPRHLRKPEILGRERGSEERREQGAA